MIYDEASSTSFFIRALKGDEKLRKVTWLGYLGGAVALTPLFVLTSGERCLFLPIVMLVSAKVT